MTICNQCTWQGKCCSEKDAGDWTWCPEWREHGTKRAPVSARLAFEVYKLALTGMEHALNCRHSSCDSPGHRNILGIMTSDDKYALEYQAYNKMRDSAERVLQKKLEALDNG